LQQRFGDGRDGVLVVDAKGEGLRTTDIREVVETHDHRDRARDAIPVAKSPCDHGGVSLRRFDDLANSDE